MHLQMVCSQLQTEMASRLARVALLRTRVKPSSTYNVPSISSRRPLHVTSGMMDGPTLLPDEFMEQAKKEGEEKEKERREADREEEIKLELLDASLKQVSKMLQLHPLIFLLTIVSVFSAVAQVMRYGWSKDAVRAAAEELGRPSVVAGLVKVPKSMTHTHIIAKAAIIFFQMALLPIQYTIFNVMSCNVIIISVLQFLAALAALYLTLVSQSLTATLEF